MEHNFKKYTPITNNIGFLMSKVPENILAEIKLSVDDIQKDFSKAPPHNEYLVGKIDKEYILNLLPNTSKYIEYAVEQYCDENPEYLKDVLKIFHRMPKLIKGPTWVNFQKKHEYNPIHSHTGVFSYVIWYQIPFTLENEVKYGPGKYNTPPTVTNGDFCFVFGNNMGGVESIGLNIDKKMEGYMAIFPSSLNHMVYPFYTSNDYRITLSGNIYLK